MKVRSTKNALIASLLVLTLCISMLIGSTFAWFTDEVVSTGNKIQAGTLDIELYALGSAGWVEITEDSDPLFNYDKWEPGYTAAQVLKVKNAGNLALKWQAQFASANALSILADVIDVYVKVDATELPDNRDLVGAGYTKVGTVKDFVNTIAATTNGTLEAGAEATLGLALKMQETAGNEYQGLDLGGAFDIRIYATQLTSEEDFFDKNYDAGAPWTGLANTEWYEADPSATEFVINGPDELAGLAKIVNDGRDTFIGDTIKLGANIDLNNTPWTPIGSNANSSTKFCGTFNGNGYTIYNLKVVGEKNLGLFGATSVGAHIENVKVVNATVTGVDKLGVILGGGYLAANCIKDCTVENATVIATPALNASGVYDDGAKAGLIAGQAYNGNIVGCTVKNSTVKGYRDVGAIAGMLAFDGNAGGTVKADGNTVANVTVGVVSIPAGAAYADNTPSQNVGAVVGRVGTGASVENSIVSDDVIVYQPVADVAALEAALANGGHYIVVKNIAVDANTAITLANGKTVVLDLNGFKVSATADKTGNQELFLVKGNMTVVNGSMEFTAKNNQEWNAMATIFDVTAGGVLKMDSVTAEVSGTDMNFIVHLNNWGSATLEMTNCDITTTYVGVRAFNSGYDMNTVTIKDTDFHGGRMFWVHNYTSEGKDDSTLTLDIYGNGNTSDNEKPVRFGFSDYIYFTIDGVEILSKQADFNAAIANKDENIALDSGSFELPSVSNGEVTISGGKDTEITVGKPNLSGSDLTLEGVTVKGSGYSTGVQHVNTVTYNDATIVGEMCLYGEKVVFNNCTFELSKGQYLWTYGAKEVEFNNCTFNSAGKAILVYNEGAGASKVSVKGCTFNATAGDKAGAIANQNCAAIEIDNFQSSGTGAAHVVITENNKVDSDFSGEWRIKNYVSGNAVKVNGADYNSIAIDGKTMTIDASLNVTVND